MGKEWRQLEKSCWRNKGIASIQKQRLKLSEELSRDHLKYPSANTEVVYLLRSTCNVKLVTLMLPHNSVVISFFFKWTQNVWLYFRFCFVLCYETLWVVSVGVMKRNDSSVVLCRPLKLHVLFLVTAICLRKLSHSCGKDKGFWWLQTFFISRCWLDKRTYFNVFSPGANIFQWSFALIVYSSITNSW